MRPTFFCCGDGDVVQSSALSVQMFVCPDDTWAAVYTEVTLHVWPFVDSVPADGRIDRCWFLKRSIHSTAVNSLSHLTGLLESSGSLAETDPTMVPTGAASETIIQLTEGVNTGGSSTSSTCSWTVVRSLNGPTKRKRGSTMRLETSTCKEKLDRLSKSRGCWKKETR